MRDACPLQIFHEMQGGSVTAADPTPQAQELKQRLIPSPLTSFRSAVAESK